MVYNNKFPERVSTEVVIPGAAPITTSNTLQELRTLWYDDTGGQVGGQIRAYNVEGRVFMELLGDVRGPNTRHHLGFEIVDVIRQPAANDVTIELGEKLTADAADAYRKREIQWVVAEALLDAVRIEQMRGQTETVQQYAQRGVKLVGELSTTEESPDRCDLVAGRMYFYVGSTFAAMTRRIPASRAGRRS